MLIAEYVSIFLHTSSNVIGLTGNSILLFLILCKTPRNIRTYSVFLFNFGLTDFFGCLAALFVQQRLIPVGTSLAYISSGPCKYFGTQVCYVGYSWMLHCYSHSLWSLMLSFLYRYHVLRCQTPTIRRIIIILSTFYSISLFQFISFCFASDDPEVMKEIIHHHFPSYILENHLVSGTINIFEWKALFTILHMTLPAAPVFCLIIIVRKRTIKILRGETMSEYTKGMHQQLLNALTFQATLPGFFLLGVVTYALGQTGIFNHPVLEYSTFLIVGVLPILSPIVTIYFIRPYNNWVRRIIGIATAGPTKSKMSSHTHILQRDHSTTKY